MSTPEYDFSRYFVLSIIYDSRFRAYCIDQIRSEWLPDPDFRLIYEQVVSLHRKERPVTFLSVWSAVRSDTRLSDEKAGYLADLIAPYTNGNDNDKMLRGILDNIVTAVEEEVSKALLTSAMYKSTELFDKGQYHKIFKLYKQIENMSLFVKPREVEFLKNIDQLGKSEDMVVKRGIPTGIIGTDSDLVRVNIDELSLRKGIGRGELCIIQGLSGAGKSTFALNIAAHQILRGYNVMYVTLELPVDYLINRLTSLFTDIPTADIVSGSRRDEAVEEMNKLMELFPDHGDIKFFQYRANQLTMEELGRLLAISAQEGMAIDSLITDYLDLMRPTREYRNRWEEIETMAIEFRDLGTEYQCATTTPSQANRKAGESKSGLTDRFSMAGSFAKIFGADMSLALTVDKVKLASGGTTEVMQLLTDKSRFGRGGGVVQLDWEPDTGRVGNPIPGMG